MLKLYYAPRTVSAAVAIALHETATPFEAVLVDFKTDAQTKPEYHAVNPKGRVPALVTDRGVLTETIALLEYVAALAAKGNLVPSDPFVAAKMRETMTFLASTMHINHAMGGRGPRWGRLQATFDDLKSKVTENITANCAHIETNVLQGPYVTGKDFSLADIYLFTVSTWLPSDGVDIAEFPRFAAFQQRILQRPATQAAQAAGFF